MIKAIFLRLALLAWPTESRAEYAHEIRAGAAQSGVSIGALLNIAATGLALRSETFLRDLAYAFARLRRAPLFVAVVLLTFALGIGVNVAVFSALNAMVLRPLPFPNAKQLVTISKRMGHNRSAGTLTPFDVRELRAQLRGVTSISGIINSQSTLLINGLPKTLKGTSVTSTFFTTIDARPEIGRLFQPSDARIGQHSIVISDHLWRTYFSASPSALGKPVTLDGIAYTIVGVMPAHAEIPDKGIGLATLAQPAFVTVMPDASPSSVGGIGGYIGAIAALAPGTSLAQINAELRVASARVQALYPRSRMNAIPITFFARPLAQQILSPVASGLWLLLLAVFGILLIACANVANLIVTRWSAQEREVAIRRALGASRRRIAAQLFMETGVLAIGGGVVGVVLVDIGLHVLPLTALNALPRANTIAIDGTALLYALLMVCVTTLLAGLAPVLSLGRAPLQIVLNSAGRSGDASRGRGLRSALVVVEVAIALALVISSGLVVRSLLSLANTPLGIRTDGVYESALFPPFDLKPAADPRLQEQQQQLLARVQALPGVDTAALSLTYPLLDLIAAGAPKVTGKTCSPANGPWAIANSVSPDYFRAYGIPLLRGRGFSEDDTANRAPVAVVSQGFVDRFFDGRDPIGKRVGYCGSNDSPSVIVGVVPNVVQMPGEPAFPVIYSSSLQQPPPVFELILHVPHSNLTTMRKEIQSAYAAVFPDKQPPNVYTVAGVAATLTQTQRSEAALLGMLALIALLLALAGIYGVVSFGVAQRSREFGIRIALGARTQSILIDVLRRSLITTTIGVAIGTLLALLDARAIAPYLTGRSDFSFAGIAPRLIVSPLDPLTFGIVIALIVLCSAVAALIPAFQVTRVDPVVTLRYE